MNTMYEGQYIVNSFHAVNKNSKAVIAADEKGYIALNAGDTIVFRSIYDDENVPVNTLVVAAGTGDVKLQINDNTVYPFYVEAGDKHGISNMRIYSFTALTNCTLYYEGIVC